MPKAAPILATHSDASAANTATTEQPGSDAAAPAPKPTPDNTPIPGGGRWAWDDALAGWVSQDAAGAAK